ncbi:MAG: PEP-CTERM sorting domain-containing protein [candidate division Zixibacteria bacterium]|nr:PEP-CTERM sorting domain-containing protein [candidate division Zixibacteria bacterium]
MTKLFKLMLVAVALMLMFATGSSYATWFNMDFTNATLDLGNSSQIDITDQYKPDFHLEFGNAYRYIDSRDPFSDDFGMSNGDISQNGQPAQVGRMHFLDPQTYFELDVWTIDPRNITVDVYDASLNYLGSSATFGSTTGTTLYYNTSYGPASYIDWHDDGGFVSIANVRYDLVPEPGTLMLLGLGLAGVGILVRRQK